MRVRVRYKFGSRNSLRILGGSANHQYEKFNMIVQFQEVVVTFPQLSPESRSTATQFHCYLIRCTLLLIENVCNISAKILRFFVDFHHAYRLDGCPKNIGLKCHFSSIIIAKSKSAKHQSKEYVIMKALKAHFNRNT